MEDHRALMKALLAVEFLISAFDFFMSPGRIWEAPGWNLKIAMSPSAVLANGHRFHPNYHYGEKRLRLFRPDIDLS
jgi:hypothetical protein